MCGEAFCFEDRERNRLAGGWLLLALLAMMISTLFAFLLVILRTPFLNPGWLDVRFFTRALVLHVDFAVIIWFMSFAGVLWSLSLAQGREIRMGWVALWLALAGVATMLFAALKAEPAAMLSNYIPVLKSPLFLGGLGTFALAIGGLVLLAWKGGSRSVFAFAGRVAGAAVLLALLVLIWNVFSSALSGRGEGYFEALFWGPGHILQFSYMLLMLVAWLLLARLAGIRLPAGPRLAIVFMLALAPLLCVPVIQWSFIPGSMPWRHAYTELMRYGSWLPAWCLGALLLLRLRKRSKASEGWASRVLVFSFLLFSTGLLAGSLIRADNVLVTAHYHGTVGAVTLSFMGVIYYLLPRLGASKPEEKWLRLQVGMYGTGMLLLISGLFWSGLHDVPRKTPEAAGAVHGAEITGMLLMGTGGLIALSATVMFLFLALRALWPVRDTLFQAPGHDCP